MSTIKKKLNMELNSLCFNPINPKYNTSGLLTFFYPLSILLDFIKNSIHGLLGY